MAEAVRINKGIAQWNAHIDKYQYNKKNYKREAYLFTNNLTATSIVKWYVFILHSQDMAPIEVETNMKSTIIPEVIIPNHTST